MKTTTKAIILIVLSVIGFIIQLHFQTKGTYIYTAFLEKFTMNSSSGLVSIITNNFLHANIIHLGLNMFFLYMLSKMYRMYNSKFIPVYIYSGLLASIFSYIYVSFISNSLVLGASGAIFGIFSYIMFKENKRNEFYINFLIVNIGMVAIGMNIAWYAHLGGAISGILYYYYENDIIPKIKRKKMRRI